MNKQVWYLEDYIEGEELIKKGELIGFIESNSRFGNGRSTETFGLIITPKYARIQKVSLYNIFTVEMVLKRNGDGGSFFLEPKEELV